MKRICSIYKSPRKNEMYLYVLKAEALTGLRGERLTEGLAGQWIQPYWLWLTVCDAGGRLQTTVEDGRVALIARLPSAG